MVVMRVFGGVLLFAAFAVLIFDATYTSSNGTALSVTSLGDAWAWVHSSSQDAVRQAARVHLPALFWDPVLQTLLRLPIWLCAGVLGIVLSRVGHIRQAAAHADTANAITTTRATSLAVYIVISAVLILSIFDLSRISTVSTGFSKLTLGDLWSQWHAESLQGFQIVFQSNVPSQVWDPGILSVLRLPVWLIVCLLVFGLYRLIDRRQQERPTASVASPQTHLTSLVSGHQRPRKSELALALASCRGALLSIGLFSALINMLMLTGAFFMLEIYDRVLPSHSVATLLALAILVFVLFSAQGMLDIIRNRLLVRIGGSLDDELGARVYNAVVQLPLRAGSRGEGLEPLRDLDTVRSFLSGTGPTVLFDLPWIPVYLGIIFMLHPMLGWTALVGAAVLITLTLLTEALTRRPMQAASGFAAARNEFGEVTRRNAEVLVAMGMSDRASALWKDVNREYIAQHRQMSDVAGGFGSTSKALRMMLQSAVLGVGAYYVIQQEATAGIIIAGAILVARALAPVDLAIANWKGFVAARQSWRRLNKLLDLIPLQPTMMALPAPQSSLAVEHASAMPPSTQKLVLKDINFTLSSGQGLGIIGPSASGKSSLVRLIVGVWQPARGRVKLDGAALDQWRSVALGQHIGYLPQDVELFAGSVAENISRFDPEAPSDAIIAAARSAGVHDLVLTLPNGYETDIGDLGQALSAGQRQRVALARALYGDPFLVVLDEPNSNLDSEGEAALMQAILRVRKRGGIVVVVAHRPSALAGVEHVLALNQGQAIAFGPRDEVLSKVVRPPRPSHIRVVGDVKDEKP